MPAPRHGEPDTPPQLDLSPGRLSTEQFPRQAWRAAWRRAAHHTPGMDSQSPAGVPELRAALAAHLNWSLGLGCTADQIVVTGGVGHGLQLLARAHAAAHVALEDPGRPALAHALQAHGLHTPAVATDTEGMLPESLPPTAALAVVTPGHQFPTGGLLSLPRRRALLHAARRHGVLLVEDTAGAEFRHAGPQLPPLARLARMDGAAHIGTLATLMTPALDLGYLVTSTALAARVTDLLDRLGTTPSPLAQHAAADLLTTGAVRRHLARTRHLLTAKRQQTINALTPLSHCSRISGTHTGWHAVLELHPDIPARAVQDRLTPHGIQVPALADYYRTPATAPNALVIGYGGLGAVSRISRRGSGVGGRLAAWDVET
ncbi:PLP-dependent aminotransferase family protein [Streptomyces sp. NPDC002659]|uniref:aminotransferase-like domain-containing protein n=1 Tax=Streptomyces sp. NPDC002659 TaxID=3364656 RepID=UPI0036C3BF0B